MPAFDIDFSTYPAGANTQDVPAGFLRVQGTGNWISYITGNPKHWFVSTGVVNGYVAYYKKDGFDIANTGFAEIDFVTPPTGGAFALVVGNWQTVSGNVTLYYWGYGGQIILYVNGGGTVIASAFPNENIRMRIARNVDSFTFTVTRLNTNTVVHTSTQTVLGISQFVRILQAEVGYKIQRFAGEGNSNATFNFRVKLSPPSLSDYTQAATAWDTSRELTEINLTNDAPLNQNTNWNGVITGFIKPLYSETYTFSIESDDFGQMYLDDVALGTFASSLTGIVTAQISLVANQIYAFRVHHNQSTPPEYLRVRWQSASQALQFVPASLPPELIAALNPVVIDPIETIRPPATYPNTNIIIPPSPIGAAPQTLTTSAAPFEGLAADVLRGFDNLGYAMLRPKRLSGIAKLEDDIWRITSRILLQTSLRTRLVASEQGLLAARIKRELENPVNWWAGQDTPIVLQKIVITRRDIARIGGIALQADTDGDLAVFVNYLERSTGIEVQRDGLSTLTIPFGAFDGGN
jgi:hypothetical protein